MLLDVRTEFRDALDERLAASAQMVHNLLGQMPTAPSDASAMPEISLESVTKDGVACEIRLSRGDILRAPSSPQGLGLVESGYNTRTIAGQQWRSYTLEANGRRVTTADRVDKRRALLGEIVFATVVPFLVAMAGSCLYCVGYAKACSAGIHPSGHRRSQARCVPAGAGSRVPLIDAIGAHHQFAARTHANAIERERRSQPMLRTSCAVL